MAQRLEQLVFGHRPALIAIFVLITLAMLFSASRLRVDADFEKMVPLSHPYMSVFSEYRAEFGGANRVLVALTVDEGDIFTPVFFDALRDATDEVFFIPGVDRARVFSLFTPNVRFTEVVEEGLTGGNIVPSDFSPTPEGLAQVRDNVLRSDVLGRLVADDFTGALISAELLDIDPVTGQRLDYVRVAADLEARVRDRFHGMVDGERTLSVHIIGFARVVGDIAAGLQRVMFFFLITLLITAALVLLHMRNALLAALPLVCSLVAVFWGLGVLPLIGYGIDPLSVLVPFLVFAIGVSHGIQMTGAFRTELLAGVEAQSAARNAFRRMLLPGAVALASDSLGFLAIMFIDIGIVREMAVTAAIGVAAIVLTNLLLLPVLLSWVTPRSARGTPSPPSPPSLDRLWMLLAAGVRARNALVIVVLAAVLFVAGGWRATTVAIGDLHAGVPELRTDSRYNRDARLIGERFRVGVDSLFVFVETPPEGCIDFELMWIVDELGWRLQNLPGVQSVHSLAAVARVLNAGWNEGSLKWRELPRDAALLAQAVSPVPTASGLLDPHCGVMPIHVFTADHRAETIDAVIHETQRYASQVDDERVRIRLAGGNLGVMAATNRVVADAQFPILAGVFAAVFLLCAVGFRSVRAALVIVVPLALVSVLAYALMNALDIGLKPSTLPVVALGAGIGVDYGIYVYSRLRTCLRAGMALEDACRQTLARVGTGVLVTGATLSAGVASWIMSPLKFQADMGTLLMFMFVLNMLGALVLLPALVRWLWPNHRR